MEEAPRQTPARRRRPRAGSAADQVRRTDFPIVMRGYDRAAVDAYVAKVSQLVAELEASQTSQGVVQRALDEVGEQTSSILQRAHETAEEIAARSRSQAEGRLQRAEQEADELRRDADDYAGRVVEDTQRLWEDRQRLLEDMRQLADEVLGVADDGLDRLARPDTNVGDSGDIDPDATQAWAPPSEDEVSATTAGDPTDARTEGDADVTESEDEAGFAAEDDLPTEGIVRVTPMKRPSGNGADDATDETTSEFETPPGARKRAE